MSALGTTGTGIADNRLGKTAGMWKNEFVNINPKQPQGPNIALRATAVGYSLMEKVKSSCPMKFTGRCLPAFLDKAST